MKTYKAIIIIQFLFILFKGYSCAATYEQMVAAAQLMRDVCEPRYPKISQDILNNLHKRILPEDPDVKCYVNCIMEVMGSMKKGKYSAETTLKQADMLVPVEIKEEYKKGIIACKGITDGIKNHCEGGFTLLKCLQKNVPNFHFP